MRNFLNVPLLVLSVVAVLGFGWSWQHCRADPDPPPSTEIEKLIAQLGSESFQMREAATRQLQQHEEAIPALRRALKSPDGEVARRAESILEFFVRQEKKRAFTQLTVLGKEGRVDQAVEKLVRRKQWDDEDACWQVMAELAGRLSDLEGREFGTVSLQTTKYLAVPAHDFRRYREKVQPAIVIGSTLSARDLEPTAVVVRAEALSAGRMYRVSLFATSGPAKPLLLIESVVFAGDSVTVTDASRSLIVCDGDFTETGHVHDSLIIARGDVHCFNEIKNSRIITGGTVHLERKSAELLNTKVKEKEARPLGFVTFFDPAQLGIKVEKADGGLRVKEAAREKPFARAGLRAGDLVIALDSTPVTDPEVFRRLLRAKVAVEGELAVKLRRGEQTLELRVPCKD
jgi:hypothetical protein